jgi:hypothetical protein
MKQITLISMIVLSLVLTACGGTQSASQTGSPTAETLPAASRLVLGTFKLEGTENTVTAEQAAELLPLWQIYASLTQSDTAAQAEIDALVEQIEETMRPGQAEAINEMGLTKADVMVVMAEQKIVEAAPQQSGTVNVSSGSPQGGPDGGMPPSDMGGGDPAMAGGAVPMGTSGESTESTTTQITGEAGVPSVLVEALIQLLQSKIG